MCSVRFLRFKTAHSLRRHLIQVHNLSCDTIVQGHSFLHTEHVMRRPNDREKHQFLRTIFPGDWAVSQRPDVDPVDVSDQPPPHHRFIGLWANIRCVPICNAYGADNLFGRNHTHDITINQRRFGVLPTNEDWNLRQKQGRGDARELHRARSQRQTMKEQLYDRERRGGRGRACVVDYCGEIIPGRPSLPQPVNSSGDAGRYTDVEEREIICLHLLQHSMKIAPTEIHFLPSQRLCQSGGWKALSPLTLSSTTSRGSLGRLHRLGLT